MPWTFFKLWIQMVKTGKNSHSHNFETRVAKICSLVEVNQDFLSRKYIFASQNSTQTV